MQTFWYLHMTRFWKFFPVLDQIRLLQDGRCVFPHTFSTLKSGVNSAVLYLVDRPSQRAGGLDSSSVAENPFS